MPHDVEGSDRISFHYNPYVCASSYSHVFSNEDMISGVILLLLLHHHHVDGTLAGSLFTHECCRAYCRLVQLFPVSALHHEEHPQGLYKPLISASEIRLLLHH